MRSPVKQEERQAASVLESNHLVRLLKLLMGLHVQLILLGQLLVNRLLLLQLCVCQLDLQVLGVYLKKPSGNYLAGTC